MKTEELALELRAEIGKARDITSDTDFSQVFLSAETIIGILAYLISPVQTLEQQYRQIILNNIATGDSVAKAEAKAKASQEYSDWKKMEKLCDLGHEQVLLLKKFANKLESEYDRS